MAKVTWDAIFRKFKETYPKKANGVLGFKPYDYATVLLIFPKQKYMTFNYDTKELCEVNIK